MVAVGGEGGDMQGEAEAASRRGILGGRLQPEKLGADQKPGG